MADKAWYSNPAVIGVLVVLVIVVVVMNLKGGGGNTLEGEFKDFPFIYATETGETSVITGPEKTQYPFDANGKKWYQAYVCTNKDCPSAKEKGKALIFAFIPPKNQNEYPVVECPACKKANLPATSVERYYDEAGKKRWEEIKAKARAMAGKK